MAFTKQTLGEASIWHLDEVRKEPEVTRIKCDYDPIARAVCLRRQYLNPADIFEIIKTKEVTFPYVEIEDVTKEDRKRAKEIRTLFKNRMIFRRLQGQEITPFMEKVERILEDERAVDSDCLAVLVRLPDFYEENVATSELFKQCKSIPFSHRPFDFEGVVTLEGKIHHQDRISHHTTYYWKTQQGFLIAVNVKYGSREEPLWEFLAKLGTIGIRGEFPVSTKAGYDLRLARPYRGNYEIYHP